MLDCARQWVKRMFWEFQKEWQAEWSFRHEWGTYFLSTTRFPTFKVQASTFNSSLPLFSAESHKIGYVSSQIPTHMYRHTRVSWFSPWVLDPFFPKILIVLLLCAFRSPGYQLSPLLPVLHSAEPFFFYLHIFRSLQTLLVSPLAVLPSPLGPTEWFTVGAHLGTNQPFVELLYSCPPNYWIQNRLSELITNQYIYSLQCPGKLTAP